jgi:UDP-N-acetyl-D-glucosamine dehydrogenase
MTMAKAASEHLDGIAITDARAVDTLAEAIHRGTALVGVIGLGYVGLPLALAAAGRGYPVLGFDTDESRVASVNSGDPRLQHIEAATLLGLLHGQRFAATADLGRLAEPDVIIVCVPTPLTPEREPDLRFIAATVEALSCCLRPGQLVVLESTTYPGTTAELLLPALARTGLTCGVDFFVAYSPERVSPGDRSSLREIPKVVGPADDASRALATAFYGRLVERVVPVSGTRTAEATKLFENIFRAVNIALVNEMKMVYERMGIDIWEVLDAAQSKPFGFMRFDPGPGWGGHCIPIDPFYLAFKARAHGMTARFVELAGEINARMPEYVVERLTLALGGHDKRLRGARILVLGLAYKGGVDDIRESPSLVILQQLVELGAVVAFHDPLVPHIPPTCHVPGLAGLASVALDEATIAAQDAVLLITAHAGVDYDLVRRCAALLVDTRGGCRDGGATVVRA